jgi:hypothetical protein
MFPHIAVQGYLHGNASAAVINTWTVIENNSYLLYSNKSNPVFNKERNKQTNEKKTNKQHQ